MSRSYTELEVYIPMEVPGKGKGYAMAVIDYGQEHHLMWVIAMDATGEVWTVANPDVRVQNNWTMGRSVKPVEKSIETAEKKEPPRAPKPTMDLG